VRTFVAIELDEACRAGLVRAIDALKPRAGGVRWVKPEALHLTLKFIGELRETDVPAAIECMMPVAAQVGPFAMAVSGLAAFPPRGAPRVIHVGVQEPTGALESLQVAVEHALHDALGVRREGRRYQAHVTLGRVKDPRRCPRTDELAASLPKQDFGAVEVDSFVLMWSELRADGPVYTPLHRFALGAEEGAG
jgi:2'-5' RNA ligase